MHTFRRSLTRFAVVVFFTVVAWAGTEKAQALEFGSGDLVLALYGNTTEYLRNLGQVSNLFSGGSSVTINIDAADFTAVGGTNPVKWALYGWSVDGTGNPANLFASSTKALSQYTSLELSQVQVSNSWNVAAVQSGQMSGDGIFGKQLLSASNPNSFSSTFIPTDRLGGGFPVSTEGTLGSLLHLLQGNYNTNGLSTIGHAILAANGLSLTINQGAPAPIPLPGAVVLFGTGLIGLVGLARRSMMRT